MTIVFIILGVLILGALMAIYRSLENLAEVSAKSTDEIRELRLTSRARISTVSMQSGPKTEVQELTRLGRTSVGKRVVVGGEDDSKLKRDLTTQVNEESDNG